MSGFHLLIIRKRKKFKSMSSVILERFCISREELRCRINQKGNPIDVITNFGIISFIIFVALKADERKKISLSSKPEVQRRKKTYPKVESEKLHEFIFLCDNDLRS